MTCYQRGLTALQQRFFVVDSVMSSTVLFKRLSMFLSSRFLQARKNRRLELLSTARKCSELLRLGRIMGGDTFNTLGTHIWLVQQGKKKMKKLIKPGVVTQKKKERKPVASEKTVKEVCDTAL
jgi:hypothetical protein